MRRAFANALNLNHSHKGLDAIREAALKRPYWLSDYHMRCETRSRRPRTSSTRGQIFAELQTEASRVLHNLESFRGSSYANPTLR